MENSGCFLAACFVFLWISKQRVSTGWDQQSIDHGPPLWRGGTRKKKFHKGEQGLCKKSKKRTRKSLRERRCAFLRPAKNRRPTLPANWEWPTAHYLSGARISRNMATMPFLAVVTRRHSKKKIVM